MIEVVRPLAGCVTRNTSSVSCNPKASARGVGAPAPRGRWSDFENRFRAILGMSMKGAEPIEEVDYGKKLE